MCETHSDTDLGNRIAAGTLGFYTHVEATEIFLVRDDEGIARNVFSLLVAEEQSGTPAGAPQYLGGRIRLQSLSGMMFGIKRSIQPISSLTRAVRTYRHSGEWQVSDGPLRVGTLMPIPPQFVPADSTESAPLNKVLKNNFWSGSHVLEMMDVDKADFQPFLEQPSRLQELSAAVRQVLPINLASLSDRLGNVVIQLAVTVLIASLAEDRRTGGIVIVRWHGQATPRDLVATCEKVHDNIVTDYGTVPVRAPEVTLAIADGLGMLRGVLWDQASGLVLAATGATAFINQVGLQMQRLDPEPRVFTLAGEEVRVPLVNVSDSVVRAPRRDRGEEWTRRRIYREEADRLTAQRRFVQYRPEPGHQQASHDKALADLVSLLGQHGRGGAWLWDPYLSADDVLRTLFRCPFANARLRALTEGKESPVASRARPTIRSILKQVGEWWRHRFGRAVPRPSFAERQRAVLTSCRSNHRELNLEFRVKAGQARWKFHDRFLIFPDTNNGPLAWTLGSSVNSLGRQHHILQQVDDARLVADAFEELWNELSGPDHLIWRAP